MTGPKPRRLQLPKQGPVLQHYTMPWDRGPGLVLTVHHWGWLLTTGWRGHGIAIGWMFRRSFHGIDVRIGRTR